MRNRLLSLLLAFCLLLSAAPAALAAPARDMQRSEITLDLNLTALVELALGAAVLEDVPVLAEGENPPKALVEGVLALGLFNLSLPYGGQELLEGKASLSRAAIAEYYQMVFAQGEYQHGAAALSPCISWREDGLDFELSALMENPSVGAHIYSAAFDGETVTLLCDLFTYYDDYGQTAENLPEDALTWLCNARVTLKYAPEMPFGYTVSGYSLSETYLNGMIYDWQTVENTEYEYSVTLPSILGLAEDEPGCMIWQTADGEATLSLIAKEELAGDYEAVLQSALAGAPALEKMENRELSYFSLAGEGYYELHLIPQDVTWQYTLILQFPPERQAEFTLYAEFICNSLTAWGAVNG